jgi:hypothetical protein
MRMDGEYSHVLVTIFILMATGMEPYALGKRPLSRQTARNSCVLLHDTLMTFKL